MPRCARRRSWRPSIIFSLLLHLQFGLFNAAHRPRSVAARSSDPQRRSFARLPMRVGLCYLPGIKVDGELGEKGSVPDPLFAVPGYARLHRSPNRVWRPKLRRSRAKLGPKGTAAQAGAARKACSPFALPHTPHLARSLSTRRNRHKLRYSSEAKQHEAHRAAWGNKTLEPWAKQTRGE